MATDLYGHTLRPGFCKVHPDVGQRYPCDRCEAELDEGDTSYHPAYPAHVAGVCHFCKDTLSEV